MSALDVSSRIPRYLELIAKDGRTVVDIIPLENEDPFTLETFDSLIELHAEKGRDFVLARVQTQDPENEESVFYSHYAAHHLNKIIFYRRGRNLVRVEALNPLTNTPICGDVEYYIVDLTSPSTELGACRSVPMRRRAAAKLSSKAFQGNRSALQICATPATAVRAASPQSRRGMERGLSVESLPSSRDAASQLADGPTPTPPPPPSPPERPTDQPPPPPPPQQQQERPQRARRMSAAAREGHRFRRQLSMPTVSRQYNTSTTCLVLHDRVRAVKHADYASIGNSVTGSQAVRNNAGSAAPPLYEHREPSSAAEEGLVGVSIPSSVEPTPAAKTTPLRQKFVGTVPALLFGTDVDFLKKPVFRARLAECALDPSDAVLFEIPGAPHAHVGVGLPPRRPEGMNGLPGGFVPHPILPDYTYQYVPGPPVGCFGNGSCAMWYIWRFVAIYILFSFLIIRYVIPHDYMTVAIIVFTTAPFAVYSVTQCCCCWSFCFTADGCHLPQPGCLRRTWRRLRACMCKDRAIHEPIPSAGSSSTVSDDIV